MRSGLDRALNRMDRPVLLRPGPLMALALGVLLAHVLLLGGVSVGRLGGAQPAMPPESIQVRLLAPPPAPQPLARPVPVRRSAPQAVSAIDTAKPPSNPPLPVTAGADLPVTAPEGAASAPEAAQALAGVAPVADPAPVAVPVTDFQWPVIGPEHWPASVALNYRLTGQDKGLNYHAQGELRWQHDGQNYALSLSVRAFLLGSREWRSVGRIGPQGLLPRRFSDHGRQERAAHFEHEQAQLILSGSTTPVPLTPGAQDQLSLYLQLAAAMQAAPQSLQGASPFRVQTATARNLVPWTMTYQGQEVLLHEGRSWSVQRWWCEPQSRWDARLELWSAKELGGLPLRIRITQVSGSYIDLWWQSSTPLPPWAPKA